MIQPILNELHSADVDDLELFVPEPADLFGFYVEVTIGLDNLPRGGDLFGFLVCSPQWLAAELQSGEQAFLFGRHHLIMQRYDYPLLRQAIQGLCDQAAGEDWESVTRFLSRFGKWEFEDYRPYPYDEYGP
ncbi:MAG TPA: Imm8 family immunity protein [Candidatus Nanopelagicaceae bacterium]|nr:Imm8 family immunity protein [Candidatus Nanopelagicaceae bacterium]